MCTRCSEVIPITPEVEKVLDHTASILVSEILPACKAQQALPPSLSKIALVGALFILEEELKRDMPADQVAAAVAAAKRALDGIAESRRKQAEARAALGGVFLEIVQGGGQAGPGTPTNH